MLIETVKSNLRACFCDQLGKYLVSHLLIVWIINSKKVPQKSAPLDEFLLLQISLRKFHPLILLLLFVQLTSFPPLLHNLKILGGLMRAQGLLLIFLNIRPLLLTFKLKGGLIALNRFDLRIYLLTLFSRCRRQSTLLFRREPMIDKKQPL